MADEAVLRIKMEGDSNSSRTNAGGASNNSAPAGSGPTNPDGMFNQMGQIIGQIVGGQIGSFIDAISNIISGFAGMRQGPASQVAAPPSQAPATPPAGSASPKAPSSSASAASSASATEGAAGGAAMGAIEGLAAMAGPIGLIVAGAQMLKQAIVDLARQTIAVADNLGRWSNRLVSSSSDPAQAASFVGDALTEMSDNIMEINPLLGAMTGVVGSLFNTLADFQTQMSGYVNRFAGFAPGLAEASAMSSVTQVLNDMRRAEEAGPALIQYVEASTRVQQKYEDVKIKFLTALMPIAEAGLEVLEGMVPYIELLAKLIPYTTLGSIAEVMKRNRDEREKKEANPLGLPTDFLLNQQKTPWVGAGPEGPMRNF